MKHDIYLYKDYRAYLRALIASGARGGRGVRQLLADHMDVQPSHVSQVLNGTSHFTPEQAERINSFFSHVDHEADYFMLLVHRGRAATSDLKQRFEKQILEIRERRSSLKTRLDVKATVKPEDQVTFYTSWLYGAVHVMLTIERFQSKEAISAWLGISLQRTTEILKFLISSGLATQKSNGQYNVGTSRIHLANDSKMISKFHANWRLQALSSFDQDSLAEQLHYSSVITLSEQDFIHVKELQIKHIEQIKAIIRESPAEQVVCFNLDFFQLNRRPVPAKRER